jgi:hypothetical protein
MGFPTAVTIWNGLTKRRAIALVALGVVGVVATMLVHRPTAEIVLSIVVATAGWWFLFLIPAAPVCLVIWYLGRRRVLWNKLDFLILVVPYATWMILAIAVNLPKSLANFSELLCLGLAINLAPIIRLVLQRSWNGNVVAAALLIVAAVVAAGIYFYVPCLPE